MFLELSCLSWSLRESQVYKVLSQPSFGGNWNNENPKAALALVEKRPRITRRSLCHNHIKAFVHVLLLSKLSALDIRMSSATKTMVLSHKFGHLNRPVLLARQTNMISQDLKNIIILIPWSSLQVTKVCSGTFLRGSRCCSRDMGSSRQWLYLLCMNDKKTRKVRKGVSEMSSFWNPSPEAGSTTVFELEPNLQIHQNSSITDALQSIEC